MKTVVITTGDIDGIGLEISIKALLKLGPQKNIKFILYCSHLDGKSTSRKLKKRFLVKSLPSISSALEILNGPADLFIVSSKKNPALWFEESVHWAHKKKVAAIVTAPLSKKTIAAAGLKDAGHTDILKRITKTNVSMAFWGKFFSVLLLSDHVSLKQVPKMISKKRLKDAILAAEKFMRLNRIKGSIGVLGLNPHAGEIKALGREEKNIIAPVIKSFIKKGVPVAGPLVPDVAFQSSQFNKHKIYVALYHDQGLIPFKIYHRKSSGVQVSINLPFIRTSVDHGTAKDIFGKGKANPESMLFAIKKALDYLR